jgi:DNA polymerase-3 subunit delta'
MGFSAVLGHARQIEGLRLALHQERLHHAYLFLGPEGVGKRTIAGFLAQAIYCRERSEDFCGSCSDCVRVQKGNQPDVRTVEPALGKKEISIQQVREIERHLSYRSFTGGKKIAIIDPAALMNLPAQNALLKTLEEPPQDSLIILISASLGGLLPTVRSRCLMLCFGPLPREAIVKYLVGNQGKTAEEAATLAALAMGSLGAAIKMDDREHLERRRGWAEMFCSLSAESCRAALTAAETLAGDREESLEFLQWVESWYRDLLIYAVTGCSEDIVNVNMLPHIQEQTAKSDLMQLSALAARAIEAVRRIQRNVNRRMAIEDLLLQAVEPQ